jgi:hypothetical protein
LPIAPATPALAQALPSFVLLGAAVTHRHCTTASLPPPLPSHKSFPCLLHVPPASYYSLNQCANQVGTVGRHLPAPQFFCFCILWVLT